MRIRIRFALVLGAVLVLALPGQVDAQYDHDPGVSVELPERPVRVSLHGAAAPQIIDPAELIEITEMDGIPVYAEVDDEWPYERLWVPVCEPEGGFQQYVPEPEVRGTTG